MKPVTDPSLLSQLESQPSGLKPVTDPGLLNHLESNNSGDYWGDVGRNAMEEAKQMPGGIKQSLGSAAKVVRATQPESFLKSGAELMQGKPFMQTPVGQGAGAAWDMAKGAADTAWQGLKDTGSLAKAPLENVPMGQTEIGQKFRNRPIGTTLGVAGTVAPLFKGAGMATGTAREAFAGAAPNFLERAGARGINRSIGVSPETVGDITPRFSKPGVETNPGRFGVDIGMQLGKEGFAGKGPVKGYDLVKSKLDEYGSGVDKALADIKAQNKSFGEWNDIADPLKHDSNPILKPFLDKANSMRESGYPNERFASRFHRAVYNDLAKASESRGGWIELDDIRSQMKKIGGMFDSASDEHLKVLKNIYRDLAKTQDKMVTEVAESSGRPELKKALLDANAGYSRYAKVLPDAFDASKKTAVSQSSSFLKHPWDRTVDALDPLISGGVYKAGRMLRGGSQAADELTAIPGRAAAGMLNKGRQVAGDQRGSIFPKSALPPDMRANEMFTPTEQRYKVNELNEQQYLQNNDFENALKAKWGMAGNSGGSVMPEDISVPHRPLTESKAREFLMKAGGSKSLARELAASEGWSF